MARGRRHGRSKSDHRVCQAARHARAAEYRERIAISAEQQEARIAALNAECNVEDAPCRRRGQKFKDPKTKASAARMSAGGRAGKESGSGKKKAKKDLAHSLGKAAERDLHSLHCQACGATAEFGLRGSKEGGTVKYLCRAHATSNGCFRVDRDRAAWAANREMRHLKAKERSLEEELRNLDATSFAAKVTSVWNGSQSEGVWADAPSAPPFAAWQESDSTTDWVSMPQSRSLIATLLLRGGVESNPGPTSQEEKELALKKSWQEIDSDIDSDLLDHLAKQQLTVERWRRATSKGSGSQTLKDLKANYPGSWLAGWTGILEDAAVVKRGQDAEAGPSNDAEMRDADQGTQSPAGTSALDETSGGTQMMGVPAGGSFDTFIPLVGAEGEGINERRRGGFFTPRVNTVHKILLCVQEKGVLILAGSPCSGKTSICQLVYTEAKKSAVYESNSVYYVNCARVGSGGKSFEDAFQDQAGVSFTEASESPPSSPDKQSSRPSGVASNSSSVVQQQKKKLLIIDEAQNTYAQGPGHHLLWPLVKEILAARKDGVNILLSASRGSNPSAVGLPSTPIAFSDDQRIPLRPRPGFTTLLGTNTAEPALQFTMDEYKQVFDTFCARIGFSKDQLQLQTLFDIIEATTERHPGSVLHVLDLLKCRSPSNHSGRAAEWADKQVEFVTSPRLLETLSGTRSFPTVSEFWNDKAALDLISKLLASRGKEYLSVIRNADPDCAEKAEELAKSGYMLLEQNVVSFTSSLHMEFYRYNLARRTWGTPQHMPGTIENFLAEALRKMKPPAFQNSLNLRSRGGVVDGVLEAHFQFELYSAITSLLPEGAYLSPTVGTIYGLQAYVDFVVHGPWKWALELLVDGRDLKEHKARFEPGGRYHPMVLGKQIESWIVVDLRNPNTSRPRRVRGPGVCHVFFDARYEEATIDFGNGNEQKVILTGRA